MNEDNAIELPGLGQIHLRTLLLMQVLSYSCNSLSSSLWLALVLHLLTIVFGFSASRPSFFSKWLGNNTISSMSVHYNVYLTPANWTFSIWGFIFSFQLIWLVYVLVSYQFLKRTYFQAIGVIPIYLYSLACIFNLVWLVLWLKGRIVSSFVALVFLSCSLQSCYSIIASNIDGKYSTHSDPTDEEVDPTPSYFKPLIRLLLINSVALYCTWSFLATILNLQIVLVHQHSFTENKSTFVCLLLVLALMISRFTADISTQAISNRYIITPYIVVFYYLVGVMAKQRHELTNTDIGIYLIVLAVCAMLFLGSKLFLAFYPLKSKMKDFNLLAGNEEF